MKPLNIFKKTSRPKGGMVGGEGGLGEGEVSVWDGSGGILLVEHCALIWR